KKIIILLLIISGFSLRAQTPVDIYYHVPFIPQPTNVSCWSSSIAMILWWRENEEAQMCLMDALTPEEVERTLPFFEHYFGSGLSPYDTSPLEFYDLVPVQPMSFPVDMLADFLRHGPVWVAYNGCGNPVVNCPHAVVIVGMHGDGTPENTVLIIHDPDAGTGVYPNLGVRDREMEFNEFVQRLNEYAVPRLPRADERNSPLNFMAYPRQSSDTQRTTDAVQETRGVN
ncbi:MAG: hypothetical protein IH592_01625, partial [Bacteroidales bacterium]|nr:hypothetical protein [Bacteroidales bacterium]